MKNTAPQTYIQQAMRTNSDTVGIYNVHPDLIHGALGLADELIELKQAMDKCDRVNAMEELGDICWFVALINNAISEESVFDFAEHLDRGVQAIEDHVGDIVSTIKRAYAYGKPIDNEDLWASLGCLIDAINGTAINMDSSLESVLELNIAKLATRYPDRFTPEQANNRDAEKERELLEKHA